MRAYSLFFLMAYAHVLTAFGFPNPVATPWKAVRRQNLICANYPATTAGQDPRLPPRSLRPHSLTGSTLPSSALAPRTFTFRELPFAWCLAQTRIFIVVQSFTEALGGSVAEILQEAAGVIQDIVQYHGDSLLTREGLQWQMRVHGVKTMLRVDNYIANENPLMLSVLNVALAEVWDFMTHKDFGPMRFNIYNEGSCTGIASITIT